MSKDSDMVDDPFRPGEKCRRWEATVDPRLRMQEAIARHYEQEGTRG